MHLSLLAGIYHLLGLIGLLVLSGCARKHPPVGTATVLVLSEPVHLDPRFPEDALGAAIGRLVWRPLYDTDPATLLPRAALAQARTWQDPTHLTVSMCSECTFHDGTPVTSADVVATFEAVLNPRVGSRLRGTYVRVLGGVHAVDRHTVTFELLHPDGTFENLLQLPILRAQDAGGPEITATPGAGVRVVGSGPMRVVSLDRGRWELARVNAPQGAPERVVFLSLRDPNTLALRLMHGDGDLAEIKPELIPVFERRPGFSVRSARTVGVTFLGVHCADPRLADPRVRQALAHAIDRESLREGKYGERAVVADSPLPPYHWAHAPGLPAYGFDPSRARGLLDEAGLLDPPGPAPRSHLVLRVSSQRFAVTVGRAIASMLADVGLDVDVRPEELPTLLSDLRAGRFDLALATIPDLTDPWGLSFWFASRSIPAPGNPDSGGNRWRYRNPTLDAMMDAGARAEGVASRRPAYQAAQAILARDLPIVPLWHADVVFAASDRYRSFTPRGDGSLDFLLDLRAR